MTGMLSSATYYKNHFPWDHLVAFLTRHGDELCKREFAIEGDYYKRYVVAKDAAELKQLVSEFKGVTSFHVGPVYSGRVVRNSEKQQSWPVRRELVFDIDLTDYDFLDLKTAEGDIDIKACDESWPICATAVFVLQWLLKDAFGFKEFMVVYSGRRGVHLYVCDDKAMNLTNEERSAIVDFLKYDESQDKMRATAQLAGMMKTQRLNEAVHFAFEEFFVKGLKLFDDPGARVAFVERLGLSDEHLPAISNLAEAVLDLPDGEAMWEFVKAKVASLSQQWMRDRLDAMVLAYVWPRIDANVSRQLNHLLKAPFVAHPQVQARRRRRRRGRLLPLRSSDRAAPGRVPQSDNLLPDARRYELASAVRRRGPSACQEEEEADDEDEDGEEEGCRVRRDARRGDAGRGGPRRTGARAHRAQAEEAV